MPDKFKFSLHTYLHGKFYIKIFFFYLQIKQLTDLNNEYSKHLNDMCNLQKDMEKVLHKST